MIPSDFYLAYATAEEAHEAFKVFDVDGNGDVTRAEIKTTVLKVYKERRFLSRSLRYVFFHSCNFAYLRQLVLISLWRYRDVSAAITTLDRLMFVVVLVILFLSKFCFYFFQT